jgi:hypothetical protein
MSHRSSGRIPSVTDSFSTSGRGATPARPGMNCHTQITGE